MPFRVFKEFNFEVLGLLQNVRNQVPKVILCKHPDKGYFLLITDFDIFDNKRFTEVLFGFKVVLNFETKSERDDWFDKYKGIINNTEQIYI